MYVECQNQNYLDKFRNGFCRDENEEVQLGER